MAPVSLDSWSVPLIDDGHNFLSRAVSVDAVEQVNVFLVHQDSLLVGGDLFEPLNPPADSVFIKTLSIGFSTLHVQGCIVVVVFREPELVGLIGQRSVIEQVEGVESFFLV